MTAYDVPAVRVTIHQPVPGRVTWWGSVSCGCGYTHQVGTRALDRLTTGTATRRCPVTRTRYRILPQIREVRHVA